MADENSFDVSNVGNDVKLIAAALHRTEADITKAFIEATVRDRSYAARYNGEAFPPNPTRVADLKRESLLRDLLGRHYAAYSTAQASDLPITESLSDAVAADRLPASINAFLAGAQSTLFNAYGLGFMNTLESRFIHRKGVIIDVAPELHELLSLTDISEDLPWAQLRLPHPAIYVHLPPGHPTRPIVVTDSKGEPISADVDGFYAFEDVSSRTGNRMLSIMLILNNRDNPVIIDTECAYILVVDEDGPIQTSVTNLMSADPAEAGRPYTKTKSLQSVFTYLTKVALYMSLPDRREIFLKDRSEANKKILSAPAGVVRKKREQKAEGLYDRIVIGQGIELPHDHALPGEGGHRAAHWRRGYYRGQRIGSGRTGVKTVWVRPTLVGAKPGDPEPARKDYLLKK